MPTAAIITEYNPFHTGHLYQINKIREITNAENIIVIMSGNYVQRGCPAIFDKYTRARMALECGCDAVIELPVYYSCASAEYFAKGAVNLLIQCGCIDYLCFGCESENIDMLNRIADIIIHEPERYKQSLQSDIKSGIPYAVSRTNAVLASLPHELQSVAKTMMSSPNAILAIEYIKALKLFKSDIRPVAIKREQIYHCESLTDKFASASAIRKGIFNNTPDIKKYIPKECMNTFSKGYPVEENDFSDYLLHSVIYSHNLSEYFDVSEFMANSIQNHINKHYSFSGLASAISGKHTTTSHSYRGLLHILLQITKEDIESIIDHHYNTYIRLLGFRKSHSGILTDIKKNSSLPIISKMSDACRLLPEYSLNMLMHNIRCDDLYRITMEKKYHLKNVKNEYNTGIIIC